MSSNFSDFFTIAMGQQIAPYPYQIKLGQEAWPDFIRVPTGIGKTAGIIIPWLWKCLNIDPDTPRRLIYCLPMRVLVEQTADCAIKWIDNVVKAGVIHEQDRPSVHILTGGNIRDDWQVYPEKNAVIIGTEDQLLSRALNRGYSMSRFSWPIHFGLLNNDCLWVMDEVQLMGSGIATSAQLQAFRNDFGTILSTKSVWMSATHRKGWLETIDFQRYATNFREMQLSGEDLLHPGIKQRVTAKKPMQFLTGNSSDLKTVSDEILSIHQRGKQTLIIVNRVQRAIDLYKLLKKKAADAEPVLIHSRYRPEDRRNAINKLLQGTDSSGGMICVATQAVEAGLDISASTLVTDIAPWPSLVQRFGRCNRYGNDNAAKVYCLKPDLRKKEYALPYEAEELKHAFDVLKALSDVGPDRLPSELPQREHRYVIRRSDIVDLFDTTSDLAGTDIDISRFIKESEDHDVQVFWRDIAAQKNPDATEPGPSKEELCPVPIGELKKLKQVDCWQWDSLEKKWARIRPEGLFPGVMVMMRQQDGCYSSENGWTGEKEDIPDMIAADRTDVSGYDDDFNAFARWETLAEHTDAVVEELTNLFSAMHIYIGKWPELFMAARWHDAGKAHSVFRKAAVGDPPEADQDAIWGKTARGKLVYERKGFRHELASALAMLEHGIPDLAVYFAAAHHGKVRLSIRSMPHEQIPENSNIRYAMGIWNGDVLPEVDLGGGIKMQETVMDLSYIELGQGNKGLSWVSRMTNLRDNENLGIFRLAFLESLLRIADWRASGKSRDKDV
jgi:CRISPR-associated endonuclease/helicase Cas3